MRQRLVFAILSCAVLSSAQPLLEQMRQAFTQPPVDCRPHTRWWWMGNALSKQDISWQLEEMHRQGIGGVEQITMQPVYERGNHPYLSPEYFDLATHAVREAKRLGMEVSFNFGGPGWIWGSDWVPESDRCRNLLASFADLAGARVFDLDLPTQARLNPRDVPRSRPNILPGDQLVAVVAGRVVDGKIQESSLTDLTAQARGRHLRWNVPAGRWRLMAFWLTPCSADPVVDHLSKPAMERYCNVLGGKYRAAFGDEFGKTVESFFSDSFEVPIFRNGLYWNRAMLAEFRRRKGYDLVRYLPAIWWEVGDISPRIRYDVNEVLHEAGMNAFFDTFLGWCERNHVRGRIQPYGFTTDILEGAGRSHIPEMEITAGEKDAVPWFDTRVGPRTYVASGAHLYGRNVISVEAYTYLHWQPGRSTLEEMKIASDTFLRAGANKFYNSGYTGTPEREFVPSRRFEAEIVVSPVNVWWRYYHLLGDYVARCSALLRYGDPVAGISVYSPLANQWTLDVLNARRWTRDFDWDGLGKLILSNGYDFDLINDDVLERRADVTGGRLRVRDLSYRMLLLPDIHALPLESMKRVEEFARNGGVVIALEQTPEVSTGLADYRAQDKEVQAISSKMFREPVGLDGTGELRYGSGYTYFIRKVMHRDDPLDRRSSVFDPFINTLRHHIAPDFGIDFVREALRKNNGLVYSRRRTRNVDIYFIANLQDRPADSRITFPVEGKAPEEWNPYTGEIRPLYEYEERGNATVVPVRLARFASTILVFAPGAATPHVRTSDFVKVERSDASGITALAARNGIHLATPYEGNTRSIDIEGIPAPFDIGGAWHLQLEGKDFPKVEKVIERLSSWTEDPATRYFSGTGRYDIAFDLPAAYCAPDLRLELDAGDVGNIADVAVNGTDAGVIWMGGQRLDVTRSLKPGRNRMTIRVTNTLINRVSGLKSVPPLPENLRAVYGRGLLDDKPEGRVLFGFEPLPRSGLLGPVRLVPLKRVRVHWK